MTDRLQHIIAAGIVAAVSLWVCFLSFTQQPAEAFGFPRLISCFFVVLALWTLGRAVLGRSSTGNGLSWALTRNLAPGLGVTVLYVFWLANALGFYTATAIAFFVVLTLYDPAPHNELKSWIKRSIITACFIAVMYGLFASLLQVYTPREVFF